MKNLARFVFAALLVPTLVNAQESETRELSGFTRIEVEGDIELDVRQGEGFEVVVVVDGAEVASLRTELRGRNSDTLILNLADSGASGNNYSATISMPELTSLELSGSGSANIGNFEVDDLRLAIAGSGDIEVGEILTDDLGIDIAGSGDVRLLAVDADFAELKIAGSGEIEINSVNLDEMSAKIAGSGGILAGGRIEDLSVILAGSGDFDGEGLIVENLKGVTVGSGEVDIDEVINGSVGTDGNLADVIGLGLDMGSMFEEMNLDFDQRQQGQRSDRYSGPNSSRGSSFLEDLVPFGAFAVPIIIVALCVVYKYRRRRLQYETLQKFAESGQPIPEHVMEILSPKEKPKSTMQSGVNLTALGLGIAVFCIAIGAEDIAAIGCIPGFVGLAKLAIWKLESRDSKEN